MGFKSSKAKTESFLQTRVSDFFVIPSILAVMFVYLFGTVMAVNAEGSRIIEILGWWIAYFALQIAYMLLVVGFAWYVGMKQGKGVKEFKSNSTWFFSRVKQWWFIILVAVLVNVLLLRFLPVFNNFLSPWLAVGVSYYLLIRKNTKDEAENVLRSGRMTGAEGAAVTPTATDGRKATTATTGGGVRSYAQVEQTPAPDLTPPEVQDMPDIPVVIPEAAEVKKDV